MKTILDQLSEFSKSFEKKTREDGSTYVVITSREMCSLVSEIRSTFFEGMPPDVDLLRSDTQQVINVITALVEDSWGGLPTAEMTAEAYSDLKDSRVFAVLIDSLVPVYYSDLSKTFTSVCDYFGDQALEEFELSDFWALKTNVVYTYYRTLFWFCFDHLTAYFENEFQATQE